MNECTMPGVCPAHSTCINHSPHVSWECVCNDGYHDGGSNGENCYDIDECNDGTFMCTENSECANLPGAYDCKCTDGFTEKVIDGVMTCIDIDECLESYHDGGSDGEDCYDINECLEGTFMCPEYS